MFGWDDFRDDGKMREENMRENGWERRGVKNRWGLAIFSLGAPNHNFSKMESELVYIVERLFGPWLMLLNSLFVVPLFYFYFSLSSSSLHLPIFTFNSFCYLFIYLFSLISCFLASIFFLSFPSLLLPFFTSILFVFFSGN